MVDIFRPSYRRNRHTGAYATSFGFGCFVFVLIIVGLSIAGWGCHVVHRLHTQEWFALIAGALAAPIGVIDGWGIWFHWWH